MEGRPAGDEEAIGIWYPAVGCFSMKHSQVHTSWSTLIHNGPACLGSRWGPWATLSHLRARPGGHLSDERCAGGAQRRQHDVVLAWRLGRVEWSGVEWSGVEFRRHFPTFFSSTWHRFPSFFSDKRLARDLLGFPRCRCGAAQAHLVLVGV